MRVGAIFAVFGMAALGVVLLGTPPMQAAGRTTHSTRHAIPPPEARVDINHASVAELMKVPGMTHTWAGRIVRFRPYHAKNDLLQRGVLPDGVYDRIKDYIIAHREKK